MKNPAPKIARLCTLIGLTLLLFSLSPPLAAEKQNPPPTPAQQTITAFLSTVDFAPHALNFDHDSDGFTDMVVYPLKTTMPDTTSQYVTIDRAIEAQQLVFREDPRHYGPASQTWRTRPSQRNQGPNILAQYRGSQRPYYQSGQLLGGGGQNRGFRGSGVWGGTSPGRPYSGRSRGYGTYRSGPAGAYPSSPYSPGTYTPGRRDTRLPGYQRFSRAPRAREMNVFCFERDRRIPEAMAAGSSPHFAASGMADPFVRKALILAPNQRAMDKIIASQLLRFNVASPTHAFSDILGDPTVTRTINYYTFNAQKILDENADACGMIVTSGDGRILCADIYASPDLFSQMLPLLMQSAALAVHHRPLTPYTGLLDAETFLSRIKQTATWTKTTRQTCKHISPHLVGETTLDGATFVHLEAYPH